LISIGIDPILFTIGSVAVSWHGIFVVLAVIVGILVSLRLGRGAGISRDVIYSTAIWAIPAGIIGARLVHVLDHLDYYTIDPGAIVAIWEGGLSIFGAVLGGTLAGVVYARVSGISVGCLADVVAPGVILAQAVGRIGCAINGDAYGTPTSLPWGFVYTHPNAYAYGIPPSHPAPVYEIFWDLIVFAMIWRLRGRLKPDGSLFLLYLSLYSLGRFFISFVRGDESVIIDGLHQAHIIALLVLAVSMPMLIYGMRRARQRDSG